MQKSIVFTEGFGCGRILRNALTSFHRHHDMKVFVFGTVDDFAHLEPHHNNILVDCTDWDFLRRSYNEGHAGTALIFAKVFAGTIRDVRARMNGQYDPALLDRRHVIHFDGDVYFKKESVSLIEGAFAEGYDIVGSRRCYLKNPGKAPVEANVPDAVSTYFLGMNIDKIPPSNFEPILDWIKMCQGVHNPLGHAILDFFDPVTFVALRNGARVKFLGSDQVGGQDENGSKVGRYESNLHLDMGEHLAHFGGVGSGYAFSLNKKGKHDGYGTWALGRWAAYAKLFYNEDVSAGPPVIAPDNRWVNGGPDQRLMDLLTRDIAI